MFPSPHLVISLPGLVMTPAFLLLIWQWDQIGERERGDREREREGVVEEGEGARWVDTCTCNLLYIFLYH